MIFAQKRHKEKEDVMRINSPRNKLSFVDLILVLLFIALIMVTFLPMVNLLARSFSSANAISLGRVGLVPVGFHLDAYRMIFSDSAYVRALWFTTYLTAVSVFVSMTLTICTAYPLSHDNLKGVRLFTIFMLVTIYFNAGIIPMFMLLNDLSMINTFWVLVIPNSISVFNVIIMRAFFFNIPHSLRESAEVEGANPFQILTKIYLPLSTPVLATLSLFYAVGRWNGFADALMFIRPTHRHLYPIQLLLFELINNMTNIEASAMEGVAGMDFGGLSQSLQAATVMFATVPILLLYPWLQRYFISGVTLGAVKE